MDIIGLLIKILYVMNKDILVVFQHKMEWSPPESTGVRRSMPESTGVHRSLPESTGVHWSPPESIKSHWSPPESSGVQRTPVCDILVTNWSPAESVGS